MLRYSSAGRHVLERTSSDSLAVEHPKVRNSIFVCRSRMEINFSREGRRKREGVRPISLTDISAFLIDTRLGIGV
jgi:hypothetical protein